MELVITKTNRSKLNTQEDLENRLEDMQVAAFNLWSELGDLRQQLCLHTFLFDPNPEAVFDTQCTKCALVCHHVLIEDKRCTVCLREFKAI